MIEEKIINRIRKMLRLGTNEGATEAERGTALRMAHTLLAKHNLDIAEIEASGQSVEDEERASIDRTFYGRPWARSVCKSVGKLFFCEYLTSTATNAIDINMVHHRSLKKQPYDGNKVISWDQCEFKPEGVIV